nr:PREDICTED: Fanconi anemia group E protein isoform X2 [Latimeria chalumnae]|eukprot:XP_014352225.1 PREDICTED: Fanconi anemia group E protein isoform X2 [Latimeria chalumnae]
MENYTALLEKFDKPYRLLFHALMSGSSGALAGFRAFQRIRSCRKLNQALYWRFFIETLCSNEVFMEGQQQKLTLKPLFHLLPLVLRRNLLSFLLLAQSLVPREHLQDLICMIRQDSTLDPWIQALTGLLERDLSGGGSRAPLVPLTSTCQQKVQVLCQQIRGETQSSPGPTRKLGWYADRLQDSRSVLTEDPASGKTWLQTSKKRKSSVGHGQDLPSFDPEEERTAKKIKIAEEVFVDSKLLGSHTLQNLSSPEEAVETGEDTGVAVEEKFDDGTRAVVSESSQQEKGVELPQNLKACLPRLKEILLETELEKSDLSTSAELQVLNECNPAQLEALCSLLQIYELPEQILPQVCTRILALSPDLSYGNAAVLVRNLFLNKALLLKEPASRFFMVAVSSFCTKYTRPSCCALLAPILENPAKGSVQVELVCRLIECLQSEHVTLVFRWVLNVPWCEEMLSVVHSVLEKKVSGADT